MKRFRDTPLPMSQPVANRRDVRDNGVVYYSMMIWRDGHCFSFWEVIGPNEARDRTAVAQRLMRARALRACMEPEIA